MAFQSNILSQILQEVNRYDFKNQVSKHNGDYKVSKMNCFSLLSSDNLYTSENKQDFARYRDWFFFYHKQLLSSGIKIHQKSNYFWFFKE